MTRRRPLLVLAFAFLLLGGRAPLWSSALGDLINAAGQGLPNVPDASPPERVDGDERDDSGDYYREIERQREAEAERQAQAAREQRLREELERQRLEQQRLEQERQRLERERLAREEQERQRREAQARQLRLRQQAAAARTQWLADDQRLGAAFDDIFGGADSTGSDPAVVDLTHSRTLRPALLRGGAAPGPSLRIRPPPLPAPQIIVPADEKPPEPTVITFWRPDWERKLTDMGFAYASMYLKTKIDGLGSIPEMIKDSLDLRQKLARRFDDHLKGVFATAQLATDPHADLGALSDRAEKQFQSFAAAVDEDARNGIRDSIATTGGGSLGDGAEAAEFGIAAGREHLQDLQELKKWCDENPARRR